MLTREISVLAAQPSHRDRALPFEKPDHRGHRVFGRNRDAHVYMIRHEMPFYNLAFLLPCSGVEDRSQLTPRLPKNGLSALAWAEHHMLLAVPFGMG